MMQRRTVLGALGMVGLVGLAAGWWIWPRFAGTQGAQAVETPRHAPFFQPDPAPLQAFYDRFVTSGGVRYDAVDEAGRQLLSDYLAQLEAATPVQFQNDDARLALYLNAYNAMTLDGVLKRWPMDSVADAGPMHRFFRLREHRIAGAEVSLHGFETKIIRRYDPRLHFALNCASASCPPLQPRVWRGETLDGDLEAAARDFIRDPRFNRYDDRAGVWRLSKIFEWYADDFGGQAAVRELIGAYHPRPMNPGDPIEYLDYDWSLNKTP